MYYKTHVTQKHNIYLFGIVNVTEMEIGIIIHKIQMFHKLLPPDYVKRIRYCIWFNSNINNDEILKIFFNDEAWLHRNMYIRNVNSKSMRLWSTGCENDRYFRETA